MLRTTTHSTKFSNTAKGSNLSVFLSEYRRVAALLIAYLWYCTYEWKDKEGKVHRFNLSENNLEFPSMLTSDIVEKSNIDTFLTGRALKCCLTQVAGMMKAATEKQRKRLYMLDKNKAEGTPRRSLKNLIKRIKQNIPQKPNCENINPELNSICANYQEIKSKDFDGYLELTSITTDKMQIRIPIKYTKHSNKYKNKGGKLKTSFLIGKNKVDLRWELPEVPKKTEGITVGTDQGMKDVLTMSDRQVTPKCDIHGHTYESIMEKMTTKKFGSKAFERCQDHRENFINWSAHKLNFNDIKQVNFEEIWNIGYKNPRSRLMFHWVNTNIQERVASICEESGVQFTLQSSTYMSQRCSNCGMVKKSNRKGKIYTCKNCGFVEDADYNASKNHEIDLPEIPYDFRSRKLNRAGFFWKESGLFDLDGRSLQSLLQKKT